jgi:hypothetical protein
MAAENTFRLPQPTRYLSPIGQIAYKHQYILPIHLPIKRLVFGFYVHSTRLLCSLAQLYLPFTANVFNQKLPSFLQTSH